MKKLIKVLRKKNPILAEKVRRAFTSAGEQDELLHFLADTKSDLDRHLIRIKQEITTGLNKAYAIIRDSEDQEKAKPAIKLLENTRTALDKDLSDLKRSVLGSISRILANLRR